MSARVWMCECMTACEHNLFYHLLPMQFAQILSPGHHTIGVHASNGLGNIIASLDVNVVYPVSYVDLVVGSVMLSGTSQLQFIIQGDVPFSFQINFGDGNFKTTTSSSSSDGVTLTPRQATPSPSNMTASDAPVWTVTLPYLYGRLGNFVVTVNLSNAVSSMEISAATDVVEIISDVVVGSSSPNVLAVGSTVNVTAFVTSGQDLSFDWSVAPFATKQLVIR